jgi:hypothetical protein
VILAPWAVDSCDHGEDVRPLAWPIEEMDFWAKMLNLADRWHNVIRTISCRAWGLAICPSQTRGFGPVS